MRTLEVFYDDRHHLWSVEAFDAKGDTEGTKQTYDSLSEALHFAHLDAQEHPISTQVNQWSPVTGVAAE